jgi:hypothetical protein
MYQPYPGGAQMPEPSPQRPAPPSVINAARVMYAGAAASLIGIVIDLTTLGDTKSAIHKRSPKLTPAQVTSAEHILVASFIIAGLIGAALWIFVAQTCKAGKNWGRIVATVLFGIDTIDQVVGAAVPTGGGARIFAIVIWLIGLAAIVLLWQRPSTEYFRRWPDALPGR